MLHTDFLDCEILNSNEKILLAILMRYDSYGKNNPPTAFPSFAGLARKSGLAEKVVKITLKKNSLFVSKLAIAMAVEPEQQIFI
jgi:hypothetical protein